MNSLLGLRSCMAPTCKIHLKGTFPLRFLQPSHCAAPPGVTCSRKEGGKIPETQGHKLVHYVGEVCVGSLDLKNYELG